MEQNVLCVSNYYNQQYYFNKAYNMLPEAVKQELRTICLAFTERNRMIFIMLYDEQGNITFETRTEGYDFDEIGAELDIRKLCKEKKELLEQLHLFYQAYGDVNR